MIESGCSSRRGVAAMIAGLVLLGAATAARAETVTRKHLDAGRVQYSGMDLNGDEFPDSIAQDNIGKKTAYFFADQRRSLRQVDPLSLPEEERRFIPDVILEVDLDGDEVRDLALYNRGYLLKYADNAAAFNRILAGGIYLGQAGDTYRDLRGCPLSDEARSAVMERARDLVLRGPDPRP